MLECMSRSRVLHQPTYTMTLSTLQENRGECAITFSKFMLLPIFPDLES